MKQRIAEVEREIAQVAKQVEAAVSKRDSIADDDDPKWARYDADVQRLGREKEQLRDELKREKEHLRDELKRREQAGECIARSRSVRCCAACCVH